MVAMKPLISIIVPVYNTNRNLEKCVNSLINQTYNNLQIILINDGSTDSSLQICQHYAQQDCRVLVLDKDNGGVSSARNLGIENAAGDYISFVDSDDWLELHTYEYLIYKILEHNTDAAMFEYFIDYNDGRSIIHEHTGFDEIISGEQAIMATISPVNRFAWSKLFAKYLIKDIRFDCRIAIGEDTLFSCMVLRNAKRVYYSNTPLYHYLQSCNSTTRSGFNYKYFSVIEAYSQLVELTSDMSDETHFCAKYALSSFLEMNIYGIYSMNMTEEYKRASKYVEELRSYWPDIIMHKGVNRKDKLKVSLCIINPKLYSKLYKGYKLLNSN